MPEQIRPKENIDYVRITGLETAINKLAKELGKGSLTTAEVASLRTEVPTELAKLRAFLDEPDQDRKSVV